MAFNFQSFSKDYTSPADQAWRTGKGPDRGTLGPNRKSDTDSNSFKDAFVSKLRDNPGYKNFYNESVFSDDTAELSQQKINDKSKTPDALFKDPNDTDLANAFLTRYSEGVSRGLIQEEDAVKPENLAKFTNEPAAARISDKDPNTVNKFPSQGISV